MRRKMPIIRLEKVNNVTKQITRLIEKISSNSNLFESEKKEVFENLIRRLEYELKKII